MNLAGTVLLGGILLLAGCQSVQSETAAAPARINKARSVEITPADDAFDRQRAAQPARARGTTPDAAELTDGKGSMPQLWPSYRKFWERFPDRPHY